MNELFPSGPRDAFPWWAAYPGHVVMLLGIMFAFQMDLKQFLPALFVLEIVTAVAQLVTITEGELAGTFVAMVVGTIISFYMSRKPRAITAFVLLIPIILALAPGSHGLRLFETLISGEKITGIEDLYTLIGTLTAIAIGMVVGGIIARRWRWIKNFKKPLEQ